MKTLFIVYAISWLILLAIYVSDKLHKRIDSESKETWGFKLFFMFVLIFFSPIVVLAVPCIDIYNLYQKKTMKNKIEKRNKNAERFMQQLNDNAERRKKAYAQRFTIAFGDLPFSPEENQVIYVKNVYDEKVNKFIKKNYDRLVTEFRKKNLEFIYLPLYFNAEIEEKIRYYAPYITEREILPSSYLLDYMLRPENKKHITPSLLFYPKQRIDEWVFTALYMYDINVNVFDIVQKVDDVIDYLTTIDVLSGVKNAEFQIVKPAEDKDDNVLFRGSDEPTNLNEPETRYGTDESEGEGCGRTMFSKKMKDFDNFSSEEKTNDDSEGIRFSIKRKNKEDDDDILFRHSDNEKKTVEPEIDTETAEIYAKVEAYVKLLRLKGIELAVIHEFIDKQEPLSPLVITDDLRIFLPFYNNIEIVMSAQIKALYFLFLNHPEGIVLQHLEMYHNELINYYKQTNKGILTPKMEESIKKLEAYGNNQLNVLIARIREAFCMKFDEHLARNYFVSGEKGEPYKIPLDPDLVEWEE